MNEQSDPTPDAIIAEQKEAHEDALRQSQEALDRTDQVLAELRRVEALIDGTAAHA